MDIVITSDDLSQLAHCARRMTRYAAPSDTLIIAYLNGTDGTSVRLVLDRQCLAQQQPHDTS